MKTIETKGSTIEAAIKAGLVELGLTLDNVKVKVLEHPGIFSKAVVRLTAEGDIPEKLDNTTVESVVSKIQQRAAESITSQPYPQNKEQKKPQQPAFQNKNNAETKPAQQAKPIPQQAKPAAASNQPVATRFADNLGKQNAPSVVKQPQFSEKKNDRQEEKRQEPYTRPERKIVMPTAEEMTSGGARAEEYLKKVITMMGGNPVVKTAGVSGDELNIDIECDGNLIIGYRGETLDALEYLTMMSISEDSRIKVNLDSGGYREKRNASLIELAKKLAEKAVRTGRKVDLEPMGSLSRKVIHSALADNDSVFTRSEGHEPSRYIVIIPKKRNNQNFSQNNNPQNKPNGGVKPNEGHKNSGNKHRYPKKNNGDGGNNNAQGNG